MMTRNLLFENKEKNEEQMRRNVVFVKDGIEQSKPRYGSSSLLKVTQCI